MINDIQFFEEQEHEDFAYKNENQAAFDLSLREMEPDDSYKIKESIKAGKHVVYIGIDEFCKFTDAYLREKKNIIKICDTHKEAEDYAASLGITNDDAKIYIEPCNNLENFLETPIWNEENVPF